jgi:hypothetical protein
MEQDDAKRTIAALRMSESTNLAKIAGLTQELARAQVRCRGGAALWHPPSRNNPSHVVHARARRVVPCRLQTRASRRR